MGIKFGLYTIIIVFVVSTISGGYIYVNNLNNNIKKLTYENSVYQSNLDKINSVVDQNNNTIKDMETRSNLIRKIYDDVETDLSLYRMYGNEIPSKLQRHDLNAIAYSKPELMEKLINEGTKNSLRCLELISGANLTDKERIKINEIYKTCPWIQNN